MASDPVSEGVRQLGAAPLDAAVAERVRRLARAALADTAHGGTGRRRRWRALLRFAGPLLVTSTAAAYLVWAAQLVASLSHFMGRG